MDGRANPGERSINIVIDNKPKVLAGLSQQGTGRAKVSPKPWDWRSLHEIGCCYPVGASQYGSNPT